MVGSRFMVFHTNPCNFEIFKTGMKYFLKHHRAQISFYFIKTIRALKCVMERFNESLKILEFTRICMENHASVTGWQNLFISYKCFQLSAAVAIATFEIQLFRERLSEKVHATIPKGIVGGFKFTVL